MYLYHQSRNMRSISQPQMNPKLILVIMAELGKDNKSTLDTRKKEKEKTKLIKGDRRDPQRTISYQPSKDGLFVFRDWQKNSFSLSICKDKETLSPQIKPSKKAQERLPPPTNFPTNQTGYLYMYITKRKLKYVEINSTQKKKTRIKLGISKPRD